MQVFPLSRLHPRVFIVGVLGWVYATGKRPAAGSKDEGRVTIARRKRRGVPCHVTQKGQHPHGTPSSWDRHQNLSKLPKSPLRCSSVGSDVEAFKRPPLKPASQTWNGGTSLCCVPPPSAWLRTRGAGTGWAWSNLHHGSESESDLICCRVLGNT